MRWLIPGLLAFLAASGATLENKKGSSTFVLNRELFGNPSGTKAEYCSGTPDRFGSDKGCSRRYSNDFAAKGSPISLQVSDLCNDLLLNDHVVSSSKIWLLANMKGPKQPVPIYRLDCNVNRAFRIPTADPVDQQHSVTAQNKIHQPLKAPPPDSENSAKRRALQKRIGKVENRIEAIERKLPDANRLQELNDRQQLLGNDLEALRRDLHRRLEDLEEKTSTRCLKSKSVFDGRSEVMVAVGGSVLRFVAIEPSGPVAIGLSEEKASELLREVQNRSSHAIVPWIFRSVPEVDREVGRFFFQDRLIDPHLYAELTGGGDAGQVSHQEVSRFLAQLNDRCRGTVRFELPTEEQFVAAAQRVYDPARNGLIPCRALKGHGSALELSQLLGHAWQLTRSLCQPLAAETQERCPDGSYVRKGGTTSSANPLECMPEYRSAAVPNIAQKETSFRLVLAE